MSMKQAVADGSWSAATLNAVHCVISTFDALTVYHLGVRSADQRHEDVVKLIQRARLSGGDEKIKQFLDVVRFKNLVEYDAEEPSELQALRVVQQSERVYAWAKTNMML